MTTTLDRALLRAERELPVSRAYVHLFKAM
jgi:hypothetical protein